MEETKEVKIFGDMPPTRIEAIINPKYWLSLTPNGDSILCLRHPEFGWLGFLIPPHERIHLLTLLARQVEEAGKKKETTT